MIAVNVLKVSQPPGLALTFNAASANEAGYKSAFIRIFPFDSYSTRNEKVFNHSRWLATNAEDESVGISGIYSLHAMPSSHWVDYFGVLPKFHGEGFGRFMMNHLIQEAAAREADHLTLWTTDLELRNSPLERFYLRNGFERVACGSNTFRDSQVHVFSKRINSPFPINLHAIPTTEWLH